MLWMIYGANGYTGRLIAERAKEEGLTAVLAGRNGPEIKRVASELGMEHRVFALAPDEQVAAALEGVDAVVHAAGPFSKTSAPMLKACLTTQTHYLDISGEYEVLERCYARHEEAKAKGIVVLPAVGADVVPTDCLARRLHEEMPDATQLAIAFGGEGHASRGTTRTMLEALPRGATIRQSGELKSVALGYHRRQIPFPHAGTEGITVPWGDLASGFRSTAIKNIEIFSAMSPAQAKQLLRSRQMLTALKWSPLAWAARKLTASVDGPNAEIRKLASGYFWAEVSNGTEARELTLRTLEPYTLTAHTAVAAVQRILSGSVPPGATTPSLAFGHGFIFEILGSQLL